MRVVSSRPLVWPPIASVADAHPAVLFLQHTAMYNTDSGRRLCCSQRLFITHKRLCLKPGMPPRVLHYRPHPLLKGPPVSSTWKSEKEKKGHCCAEILGPPPTPPAFSFTWQVYSGLRFDGGWRMVPSFSMEASHLSFMYRKFISWRVMSLWCCLACVVISTSVDSTVFLHNILGVGNPKWD